jgi:alpha-D-ribose 1-methylphosphonate 5-triphosphate diphosphatase
VTPHEILSTDVLIVDDTIAKIGEVQGAEDIQEIDADGLFVLPGLVDIHCDAIEKEVQPRPNTLFPLDMAFIEFEKKLAVHGITTMLHSLSLGVGLSLRGVHFVTDLVKKIVAYRQRRAMIRHHVHLRYEITFFEGLPIIRDFIENKYIDYLSYMNHYPGQGQYRAPGSFEKYVMKNQGVDPFEVKAIVEKLLSLQDKIDWDELKSISELAASRGIAIASHDDDSIEKVNESKVLGASVVEFPVNLETARYAAEQKLHVCVGAPNVVRGGSHDHNLSAIDAVKNGFADILCSDYHPSALLLAVFILVKEGLTLPQAVKMVSLHPAKAVRLDHAIGSIEVGKKADLILVSEFDGYPIIRNTIVDGKVVYHSDYYLK